MPEKRLTIGILIPAHNESAGIRSCLESCLAQTRKLDQILVVDDASTDDTVAIARSFGLEVEVLALEKNLGNKSFVQESAIPFIRTDIFIATDGDTILDPRYVEYIERDFADPQVAAVCGGIRSIRYNWLTALRQMEYSVSQEIHKRAQSYLNFLFVIPGCSGAFRTELFRKYITFDHDTVAEDLDFTFKFHKNNLKIAYDKKAMVYTQDPPTLGSYIAQVRRWYAGGWQNLVKHFWVIESPLAALELTLMYTEGIIFSVILLVTPFINIRYFIYTLVFSLGFTLLSGLYASIESKRPDIFFYSPAYLFLMFVNLWVFIERFVREIFFKERDMSWHQPQRIHM